MEYSVLEQKKEIEAMIVQTEMLLEELHDERDNISQQDAEKYKTLTVNELIRELYNHPGNAKVCLAGRDYYGVVTSRSVIMITNSILQLTPETIVLKTEDL